MKKMIILCSFCLIALCLFPIMLQAQDSNKEDEKTFFIRNLKPEAATDLHIEFNAPITLSDIKFSQEDLDADTPTESNKIDIYFMDGLEGALNPGEGVRVKVRAEVDDLQVTKWWWTQEDEIYGDTLKGTIDAEGNRAYADQDPGIFVRGDKLKEITLKPTLINRNDRRRTPNDLHIVTNVPVYPKRPNGMDVTGVTTCDCSQNYTRSNQPCYDLCDGEDEDVTKYVTNLEGALEPGKEVSLELLSGEKAEILQWWWTEEGDPLVTNNRGQTTRETDRDNRPPTPSRHNPDTDELEEASAKKILPVMIVSLIETPHDNLISTGQTTGTIATVRVFNEDSFPINVMVPEAFIPAKHGNQPYKTQKTYTIVEAFSQRELDVDGLCANVFTSAHPIGEAITQIENWIIPSQINYPQLLKNLRRHGDRVKINPGDEYLTIPGTKDVLGYEIDLEKFPEIGGTLLVGYGNQIERYLEENYPDGYVPTEHKLIPTKEVAQQVFWKAASLADKNQEPYTNEIISNKLYENFKKETGKSVKQLSKKDQEAFGGVVQDFVATFSFIGGDAKVMDKK